MTTKADKGPRIPPPWFIRSAWAIHRGVVRLTRGRLGLWRPEGRKWGTLRLQTMGRRSGKPRIAILGYYQDGPNYVTLAMNGWMDGEPAWWLNLQANPDATAELPDGPIRIRGRAAEGEERARLWAWFGGSNSGQLEALAARRSGETAVVILEPIDKPS